MTESTSERRRRRRRWRIETQKEVMKIKRMRRVKWEVKRKGKD